MSQFHRKSGTSKNNTSDSSPSQDQVAVSLLRLILSLPPRILILLVIVALVVVACVGVFYVTSALNGLLGTPAVGGGIASSSSGLEVGAGGTVVPPVPSSAWYQIYFTTPKYPDKKEDHHGGLDEKLTSFINMANSTVDMAIYQLDLPNVTQALLDAKKRGATVRVVTDIDIYEDPKENPSFKQLEKAGITVIGGNANAIMHNKFVVVDKAAVWMGSWNFTTNDTYRYNNNGILIQSPELARNYTVTFEKMFVDKKFGPQRKPGGTTSVLSIAGVKVENYFAPEDKVAGKIVARLKTAQNHIYFMAFSFTDDDIGVAILDRWKNGVQVRGVFEKTGSQTKYSEYTRFKTAGLDVYENPASETQVSQDGNPYLMHHKVFVIDGKTVIFGSFNFSQNAQEENDENLVIVDDSALASQFETEFARVYEQAKNPPKK